MNDTRSLSRLARLALVLLVAGWSDQGMDGRGLGMKNFIRLIIVTAFVLSPRIFVSAAVPSTTDFDGTYFRTSALPVTVVGPLTNWAKLSTNQVGVLNMGAGLVKTDAGGVVSAAASGDVTTALGYTPVNRAGDLLMTGKYTVAETETAAADIRPVEFGMAFTASPSAALTVSSDFHGLDLSMSSSSANMNSFGRLFPFESTATWGGSGTLPQAVAGYLQYRNTSSGTISTATALRLWNSANAGTITEGRYIYLQDPNSSGTIVTMYGIKIDNLGSGTTHYGVYSADTNNFFLGAQIGSGGMTITSATNRALLITQSADPGFDTLTVSQTHSVSRWAISASSSGSFSGRFSTTGNSAGGAPMTLVKSGTGAGLGLLIQNAGTGDSIQSGPSGSPNFKVSAVGTISIPKTITAAGTTGNQTINKASGSVNFAAAAQSITVTSDQVDANSVIMATVATDDTTAKSCIAVPGAGSFVLKLNAAATAETRVQFRITN